MVLNVSCKCGNILDLSVGDCCRDGRFCWYMSYHCDKCGEAAEEDDFGIDTIPKEVKEFIIEKEGKWKLVIQSDTPKVKYILKKVMKSAVDNYCGTLNQMAWIKEQLLQGGMTESDLEIVREN